MTGFSSPHLVRFLVSGGLGLMAFLASGDPVSAFSQSNPTSPVFLISEEVSLLSGNTPERGENINGFSGDIFVPLPASFAHCAL